MPASLLPSGAPQHWGLDTSPASQRRGARGQQHPLNLQTKGKRLSFRTKPHLAYHDETIMGTVPSWESPWESTGRLGMSPGTYSLGPGSSRLLQLVIRPQLHTLVKYLTTGSTRPESLLLDTTELSSRRWRL